MTRARHNELQNCPRFPGENGKPDGRRTGRQPHPRVTKNRNDQTVQASYWAFITLNRRGGGNTGRETNGACKSAIPSGGASKGTGESRVCSREVG